MSRPELLFFYSQGCHACQKTKQEVMPVLEKEFSGKIIIKYLDIADINNYKLLLALREKYDCNQHGVPTAFFEGTILVGYDQIKDNLRNAIIYALRKEEPELLSELPVVDLLEHFISFGVVAIIGAGLADGINPCAFTVIVFFISFLSLQGYRQKQLLTIGLAFIFAVFITYILIGLGIFRFLYALRGFYWISKGIYYLIAFLCFILGLFALYDLWLFKKTGKTEGMTLQLPQVIKNRIHNIIGLYYRKTSRDRQNDTPETGIFKLVISSFICGFLVSLLEAVCTGQLYLPTIIFVLKERSLRLKALWYLLLYNFMFIVPLILVLIFSLLGTRSEGFSRFLKRHLITVKLMMALLFFALGVIILIET